jgi:hypothetical protein
MSDETTMVKAEIGQGVNDYLERIQNEYDCNKTKAATLALEGAWAHGWKLPGESGEHRLAGAEPTTQPTTNNDNE